MFFFFFFFSLKIAMARMPLQPCLSFLLHLLCAFSGNFDFQVMYVHSSSCNFIFLNLKSIYCAENENVIGVVKCGK
jgi:hypothetical protein